jgi:site-specific DNA-methyltransferase (cytosine-N4-specific)
MMRSQTLFPEPQPLHQESNSKDIVFDLDSFKDKGYLTHNFHPYPAKFVPQIPNLIISALSAPGETVLDPFCGSGTTLVEASILRRRSIGCDLNPIATLMSRVKATPLSSSELDDVSAAVRTIEGLQVRLSRGLYDGFAPEIPSFRNRDHWFQPQVQQELGVIKDVIWRIANERVRDFLKVAFSAIVVKVSNQDSDTRWVAVEKSIQPGDVAKAFLSKATDMLRRMREYGQLDPTPARVYTHPVTELPPPIEPIDLIVTSPPYLNSFDYYLYHKLRFFWLELDHYSVQAREVGSRHRHCDKNEGIETYTSAMSDALKFMSNILKPGGYLAIVIGDSILKAELVEMDRVYYGLCADAGFSHEHTYSYDQRRYTTSFTRNLKSGFKKTHIMFFRN